MKALIKYHEYAAAIFVAILAVFCLENSVYGINVADRTPQVRDAIVVAAGVNAPTEVTDTHLASVTSLSLGLSNITSLRAGDFQGLTSLRVLLLNNNQLTVLPETVFKGLTSLQVLLLNNNQLTALPVGAFDGLTSLQLLLLNNNRLSVLPNGVFSGLTSLQYLNLDNNTVDPLALTVSLEKVADGQFKAVVPTGSPFGILLPIRISNGNISSGATVLTIPKGSLESEIFTVNRTPGTIAPVTVDIGTLPSLPQVHSGYALVKSGGLPLEVIGAINPLNARTPQVRDAIVVAAGVSAPAEVTEDHLAAIPLLSLGFSNITSLQASDFEGLTSLRVLLLNDNQLTVLPETIFEGLTSLQVLLLNNNRIGVLPAGVFSGLTSLQYLDLGHNAVDPLALPVSLERVSDGQFKAVAPTGSPFDILLPIRMTNGSIRNGTTVLTIPQGSLESGTLTVTRTPGTAAAVTVDIGTLPSVPSSHQGYALRKSTAALPLAVIPALQTPQNSAPVFSDGTSTTRSIAENTASGQNIGTAIAATDADNDPLTYTLGGTDASSFRIVSTSGQLQTRTALDYETKNTYTVTVSTSDGNGGSSSIPVTISVMDVIETGTPPVSDGVCRVGDTLAAGESCTYPGTDTAFSINSNGNGQFLFFSSGSRLNIRNTQINNVSYTLVAEKLNSGSWEIKELGATAAPPSTTNNAPVFDDGTSTTRTVAENTGTGVNIGAPVAATDADNDTLTYSLSGDPDATAFSIVSTSGQLQTKAPLNAETKSTYTVTITVSDGTLTDTITVTINVTQTSIEPPPVADGICRVGNRLAPGESCTYPGTDTAFSVNSNGNGQFLFFSSGSRLNIRNTQINNTSYTLVAEKLGSGSWEIKELGATAAPPSTTNNAPVFTEGTSTTRTVAENTTAGVNIGTPVAATDADSGDTLTYTLGGTDAAAFDIDAMTGQLKTKTTLNAATKSTYTVTITVSDGTDTATIRVTITITGTGITPPPIADGICRVGNRLAPGESCTYPGTDTAFSVSSNGNGQFLFFSSGNRLNIRDTQVNNVSYTLVAEKRNSGSWEIKELGATAAPPSTTNHAPVFTEGVSTTRSVTENTATGVNIGTPVAATDADSGDTLTYTLGGTDAAAFDIDRPTGQLKTKTTLNAATKSTYTVTITVSDGTDTATIPVTITVTGTGITPPLIADGICRVGDTLASGESCTYPGTDTAFSVNTQGNGQFLFFSSGSRLNIRDTQINNVSYTLVAEKLNSGDWEIKALGATAPPPTTNRAPVFTEGVSTTRSVAENTATGVNIGTPVSATDANNDTLTYTLGGTDAAAFDIDSPTGQLKTKTTLNAATKATYTVTITASDGTDTTTIPVTITVTGTDIGMPPVADGLCRVGDTLAPGETCTYPGTDTAFSVNSNGNGQFLFFSSGSRLNIRNTQINNVSYTLVAEKLNSGSWELKELGAIAPPPPTTPPPTTNNAPVFADGASTTRTVSENTASGVNIGRAVSATDADNDTLTYSLSGTDASSFRIVSTTGQLQTDAALDYERKSSYSVTVSVSDGNGGSDSIDVSISITNVDETVPNRAPAFTEGNTATRSIAENTGAGANIGSAVAATDADANTLTYTLGGTDALSFRIVSTTGQLQTNAALDYETKNTYSVSITVSDGTFTDTISVAITITDVNETVPNRAPVFTEGNTATRSIAENTAAGVNIGSAVAATDADANTLTYRLGGTDAAAFSIVSTSGQIQTSAALDYETQNEYTVSVFVSDANGGTGSITVTISVTNVNEVPTFTDGTTTTRNVLENTAVGTNIGIPVAATDPDTGDTLTYRLGGTDAASFSIDTATGQLQTSAVLDRETRASYSVTVSVSDGNGGSDSITVAISVTNVNEAPVFTGGTSTTRSVAENTVTDTNIGSPVAARDGDGDTLSYTLGGTDAASFSIVSTTGQLQTSAALDYEGTNEYSVTISASDGNGGSDSIAVTINVTDVNEPVFTEGNTATRTVNEDATTGTNIGLPVIATDLDIGDTLTYSLGGTDEASFSIVNTTGQLQTDAALDYETKTSYAVTVSVSDVDGGTDSIDVTINVNNNVDELPTFTEGATATRTVVENTVSGVNIGDPVAATADADDTLTYSLDATALETFSIVSTSGQIQTSAALDHETTDSYTVTVTVGDGDGNTVDITVTINVTDANDPPVFTDGDTATRAIAEDFTAVRDETLGRPVTATDQDNDTITYSLDRTGTDAIAFGTFEVQSNNGQLRTRDFPHNPRFIDAETNPSVTVVINASDGNGGTDSITVTVNITDANEVPAFTEGTSASRSVAENTAANTDIGKPIAATDPDEDTLEYFFDFTDPNIPNIFAIDLNTGQLKTKAALDFETRSSYKFRLYAADPGGLNGWTDVTVNVTDVNDAPVFTDGATATRSVEENAAVNTDVGTVVAATDQDRKPDPENEGALIAKDTLSYSIPTTGDAASFTIDSATGQLRTKVALDRETKASYTVTVTVSDQVSPTALTDTIDVTISVTNVNEAPSFDEGDTATRSVAENTIAGEDIGAVLAVTDADVDAGDVSDTLAYTLLEQLDHASFSIVSTTGQLQTKTALDHETDDSYTVRVLVEDSGGASTALSDIITVTISVTDANDPPVFTDGTTAARAIREDAILNATVGTPVAATDQDKKADGNPKDTITYSIPTTGDAAAFSIDSSTGQLRRKDALDRETKSSYTVTVTANDGNTANNTNTIDVTITVTDVNEAPVFDDGATTTRSVQENSAVNAVVGTAVAATDPDRTPDPVNVGEFIAKDTLLYSLSGTDAAAFNFDTATGQIKVKNALDFEATKNSYSVTVTVSDQVTGAPLTDSIDVTINVSNVNEAPVFANSTATRTIAENTAANNDIGAAFTASDPDSGTTLAYSIPTTGDAAAFSIDTSTGQLKTKNDLNYEDDDSYTVVVTASDSSLEDTISVTISVTDVNDAPTFTDGDSATRSVAENSAEDTVVGTAVAATDEDRKPDPVNVGNLIAKDTLLYSLSGTDAASFKIDTATGQLKVGANTDLDFEATKKSYSVTVGVSDQVTPTALTDSIDVTISVSNVNEAPAFASGASISDISATLNTAITSVTLPEATDQDSTNITYTVTPTLPTGLTFTASTRELAGTPSAASASTTYTYTASDGTLTDTLTFSIVVSATTPNNAPTFASDASISNIFATLNTAITSVTLPEATDPDAGTTITYTVTPTLPAGLIFTASTRVLSGTPSAVSASATYTYTASDGSLSATLTFTIQVSATANNAPVFTEGATATRSVAENTASGTSIGNAVGATDADSGTTLTYTLGGTDEASFGIVGTSGQLQTSASLNYEVKSSYSVTIEVSDGNGGSDSITVTISVTDVTGETHYSVNDVITTLPSGNPPSYILDDKSDGVHEQIKGLGTNVTFSAAGDWVEEGNYRYICIDASGAKIVGQTVTEGKIEEISIASEAPTLLIQVRPAPDTTALLPNYPNPFNPETWIPYALSESAEVTLTIYNMRGVVVRELKLGHQPAGMYQRRSRAIHWDGRNAFGEKVATGVYFYTLTAGDFTATRKLLIRK